MDREKFERGLMFKKYIVRLLSIDTFDIVRNPNSYEETIKKSAYENILPEICAQVKSGQSKFWIRCRYRSKDRDSVKWCEPHMLPIYRDVQRKSTDPTFIAIGTKGTPGNPDKLYFIPLEKIPLGENVLSKDSLREHERTNKQISEYICQYLINKTEKKPTKTVAVDDATVSKLFDILDNKGDDEFKSAAEKIGSIGRIDDILDLRKIYGRVTGEKREQIRKALSNIVDRYDKLKEAKEEIISSPVTPNEEKFVSFFNKWAHYFDIRYRDNYEHETKISKNAYTNIKKAIKIVRVRMFNEFDNIEYYSEESKGLYNELVLMMEWVEDDIQGKKVVSDRT